MNVFAVRNAEDKDKKDLLWLFYFESGRKFFIELPDEADPFDLPMPFDAMYKTGVRTIGSEASARWVRSRLVPHDRQNISEILGEARLREYDEYRLLMHAMGRCVQDSYYLVPVNKQFLPGFIVAKRERTVRDVMPLSGRRLLVFFRDGKSKLVNLTWYLENNRTYAPVLLRDDVFFNVSVQCGGYGIYWDDRHEMLYDELYKNGEEVPLQAGDLYRFISERTLTAVETAEFAGCSQQYVNELTRKGKLRPVKTVQGSLRGSCLYLKADVEQMKQGTAG